ncbi:MAG: bifunctional N(6)-L-threonylcarbamoyladenine synthase/serine/threonine protein kinase [Candidatus Hodarchaeales archaeon]
MISTDPIILGFEGTAHTAGVAVVQGTEILVNKSATYVPSEGGIHPREAAVFIANNFPVLLREVFSHLSFDLEEIDGIAFSQGPGLGPCLRTTATVARAIALKLKRPLLGVNHCVAHVELGRAITPANDPMVLYVSGGNTQLLTYMNGKYRIMGETLDIAIGNALDTLGRYLDLPHPGGPHIEHEAGKSDNLLELPYTLKGMSFSFSGIVTAAKKLREKYSDPDICFSFQEYTFAILAEATERALSCTRKESVLLTGGVAANSRLRAMISNVADEQNSIFHVVPKNLAGDNGVMIAMTGVLLFRNKVFLPIAESQVIPRWRSDQVKVGWFDEFNNK